MSATLEGRAALGGKVQNHTRMAADFIVEELSDEEFQMGEILGRFEEGAARDRAREELMRLSRTGVVESVGHVEDTRWNNHIWRVDPHAYAHAEAVVENRDAICPCGHSGMSNEGGHLECGYWACDQRFDAAEVASDE